MSMSHGGEQLPGMWLLDMVHGRVSVKSLDLHHLLSLELSFEATQTMSNGLWSSKWVWLIESLPRLQGVSTYHGLKFMSLIC